MVAPFVLGPAAWWMAMLACGAAAGWAVSDARQSWQARRTTGNSRWRLLHALDCVRSALAFVLAVELLAFGIAHHDQSDVRPAIIAVSGAGAVLYVVIFALQVLIRYRQARRT